MPSYLVQEDGTSKILLETSGAFLLEASTSLSTAVGKTGTSGSAVMQKAANGWTYITGKTGTSGTAVDQKGAGSFTKIKGH